MARQEWRISCGGTEVSGFGSEPEVAAFVDKMRASWAAGELESGSVTVQVNEGAGWMPHEYINFAEESAA